MIERGTLKKGDVVWHCQTETWDELLVPPRLERGVMVGGGNYMVTIEWDCGRDGIRRVTESRSRAEHRAYRTRNEALEAAQASLRAMQAAAQERIYQASKALTATALMLAETPEE